MYPVQVHLVQNVQGTVYIMYIMYSVQCYFGRGFKSACPNFELYILYIWLNAFYFITLLDVVVLKLSNPFKNQCGMGL